MLVLSLFPGIGLLDRAFEEEGFCVVRGPDLLWGGDIRRFHPPAGKFDGVIGGPPCQEFSRIGQLNAAQGRKRSRHGNLIPEFERVVNEAGPQWFVMENVPGAPIPVPTGFAIETFLLNNRWLGEKQRRLRRWSFGSCGLSLKRFLELSVFDHPETANTVTARATVWHKQRGRPESSISRKSVALALELQGLPSDFFKESPFTVEGQHVALGNGVPLPMGRAIAKAVKQAVSQIA